MDEITNQESENILDQDLMQFSDMIEVLSNYEKQRIDPQTGQVMTLEEIQLEFPIELRIEVDAEENLTLKSSPPTQRTTTTILPVFHHLKVKIVRNDGE